jgi:hypothetical protein
VAEGTETTLGQCRRCGSPAMLTWQVSRENARRFSQRRLTGILCSEPECGNWHPALRPRVRKAEATSWSGKVPAPSSKPAPSEVTARHPWPVRSSRRGRKGRNGIASVNERSPSRTCRSLVRRQQRPPVALRPSSNTSALAHASSLGSPSHHSGTGVPSSSFRVSSGLERLDGVCPVAARWSVRRHSPPPFRFVELGTTRKTRDRDAAPVSRLSSLPRGPQLGGVPSGGTNKPAAIGRAAKPQVSGSLRSHSSGGADRAVTKW